jgi:hypothetical protein
MHSASALSHDDCPTTSTMSFVQIANDLVTPPILQDCAINWNVSCHQTTEINAGLSAHVAKNNVLEDCVNNLPPILSAPLVEVNSIIDMNAQTEILASTNELCDLIVGSSLDHIKLVKNNEVLAKISQANSLFYITMDPPISLSHVRDKIAELTSLKSVYAPDFTFILVGEYDMTIVFLVHRICIMCADFARSHETKVLNMLSCFDMTSSFGIHSMSNNLLQN